MAKRKGFIKEFKEFIARGNVIDLAVGVVIGAAFNKIVTSFVEGLLMPPIGLLTGRVDFTNMFAVLDKSKGIPKSLADAKTLGVPVFAYGQFLNDVISFLSVGFLISLIVNRATRLWSDEPPGADEPTTKNCPFCVSTIAAKATRCPQCTSELQTA